MSLDNAVAKPHERLAELLAADLEAVGAHDDRRVADAAAQIGIAKRDLGRHIGAALAHLKGDVEPGLLEIALALGKLERRESRKEIRRRKQIGDFFGRSGGTGGQRQGGGGEGGKNAMFHVRDSLFRAAPQAAFSSSFRCLKS